MTSEFFTSETKLALPKTSGPAELRCEKGIFVMDLYGTHFEMGRQCGELSRGIVDDYVPRYYENCLENIIGHSIGHISKSLPGHVASLLYKIFASKNKNNIGPIMEGLVNGLIEAAGSDPADGVRLALFADILHYLAGKAFAGFAAPSCSGFFARDNATKDGKVVIGRNFDFFGRGVWNTNQCLTVLHPDGGQAYLWIGALGLPVGGFGLNESGIGLMIFTNFCRDVSMKGMPLFTICNEILETATSVDDAIKICGRAPRIGANTLFITDSKARDARVIGWSSHKMEVLAPENNILYRTNHYITPELKEVENAPQPWVRHSYSRFERMRTILNEKTGTLSVTDVPGILSDPVDFYEGKKRVVGDILAAVNNCVSVALSPEDDAMYIARGSYPVCNNDKFLGYKISSLFAGKTLASIDDIAGGNHYNENEKLAIAHYQEAWTEYLDRNDKGKSIYHLRRAAEVYPEEPIFHRVAGVLLMKSGKHTDALAHMKFNAEYDYRDIRVKADAFMWYGRCLDLCGKHAEAIECYRKAIATGDKWAVPPCTRHINKPYSKKELTSVDVEFVVGSPIGK